MASSKHYQASLIEIETAWNLDDLYDAHDVIDALTDLEQKATG